VVLLGFEAMLGDRNFEVFLDRDRPIVETSWTPNHSCIMVALICVFDGATVYFT